MKPSEPLGAYLALVWNCPDSMPGYVAALVISDTAEIEEFMESIRPYEKELTACDVYQFCEPDNTVTLTKYGWLTVSFSTRGPSAAQRQSYNLNYLQQRLQVITSSIVSNFPKEEPF